MANTIELGHTHCSSSGPKPAGYTQWASWIASDPDSEPFVFRKFDELGALNLLYLQSDMMYLESQLKELDFEEVRQPNIDSINAARQWETLLKMCAPHQLTENENSANVDSKAVLRAKKRMELILKLRTKMKEYHEALLLQSKVAQLQSPSGRVLKAVKQMFSQDGYAVLDGQASNYLDAEDLVAIKSPTIDHLSNYLRKARAAKDKSRYAQDGGPRIKRFEEQKITQWVSIITIIVAVVFLVAPVLALYFVTSPPARLVLVPVFTAGFAASVWLITDVRRAEIFFGSATYAAVLVVFVSSNNITGTG